MSTEYPKENEAFICGPHADPSQGENEWVSRCNNLVLLFQPHCECNTAACVPQQHEMITNCVFKSNPDSTLQHGVNLLVVL